MKHPAIQERRAKVSYYLVKGMPEDRIAELLGVHRNTISRDVAYLRKGARDWLDELARDGFIREYQMALQKLRDHEYELQKLLLEAGSVRQKTQVLRALDENVKLYLELLGETPAVHAFRRALRKLQERGRGEPGAQQP